MSKLMKHTDGTWRATRRVANGSVSIYVREIGHGYFGCTAAHSHTGVELADTIGESRKVAIDRALAIAKRKLAIKAPAMPSDNDFSSALGPCGK